VIDVEEKIPWFRNRFGKLTPIEDLQESDLVRADAEALKEVLSAKWK
jgi:hypothetical protein